MCDTLAIGLKKRGSMSQHLGTHCRPWQVLTLACLDLALLDVRMPNMSGFELYMKLRDKDSRVNVCFLTAFEAFDEFKALFPELATWHFMKKPTMISSLVERLNLILSEARVQ